MNAAQVMDILRRLGVSEITQDEEQGVVRSSCPLAAWKHKGVSSVTSLTVKRLEPGKLSTFACSVCKMTGTLADLIKELEDLSGWCYPEVSTSFTGSSNFGSLLRPTRRRIRVDTLPPKVALTEGAPPPSLGDADLEAFPLLANSDLTDAEGLIDWLRNEHGISPVVAYRHGLRLHIDPSLKDARVALPVIAPSTGDIQELWIWLPDHGKARRVLTAGRQNQGSSQATSALFGLECISPNEPVFLVQSALGAMRLESLRLKNVVAVLGGAVPDLSALDRASAVFLAFDETPEGLILTKQAARTLNRTKLYLLRWSDGLMTNGKYLRRPEEVESLASFRAVFEKRIMLAKTK